ncbi:MULTISPECIES: cation diffusion facilitator family transporter [Desulfosediminicola]|uniref:cation diffusion facilitator family transporter n=1 Tax=Desulfosediminicola TaxID=2886823 RepID=UPI0010ABB55F|nr:cation diffusion facilitator family transporter [Desulfosediminicola ganghwensis]
MPNLTQGDRATIDVILLGMRHSVQPQFLKGSLMEISEKTAFLSILANFILVAIKIIVALFSGSLAVKADALHSVTDVISSVVILIGIKISKRRSRHFPYGLYKVENLIAMGTSLLIAVAGYEIGREVFSASPRDLPTNIPQAIAGISLTICIAFLFSCYELRKGREALSPSLVADAQHILSDVFSSLVILTALIGSASGFNIDRYCAVIVIFFIVRSAASIFINSMRVLLDASLDYDTMTRIRELVLSDARVRKINGLWGRNAGRYKFVELDLTLCVKDLEKGHRIAEEIENRIKMNIKQVDRVLIHYQPEVHDHFVLAAPLQTDRKTLSEHFGGAPLFHILHFTLDTGRVTDEHVLVNPHANEEKGRGIKTANWLLRSGIDILITNHDQTGKGPALVFGNAGVEILLTRETQAAVAMNSVRENILTELTDYQGAEYKEYATGSQLAG